MLLDMRRHPSKMSRCPPSSSSKGRALSILSLWGAIFLWIPNLLMCIYFWPSWEPAVCQTVQGQAHDGGNSLQTTAPQEGTTVDESTSPSSGGALGISPQMPPRVATPDSTTAAVGPPGPNPRKGSGTRVVLSYLLTGCPSGMAEVASDTEQHLTLSGQEASHQTMNLLRDRLSMLLHSRRVKHTEAFEPRDNQIFGYGSEGSSLRLTNELESRYLSSLQMEVIKTIPTGVTDNDVIQIARGLPCVEQAYHDSFKFAEEQPTHGGQSRVNRQLAELSVSSLGTGITRAFESGTTAPNIESGANVPPNDPSYRWQWNLQDRTDFGLHAEKAWRLWTGEKRPMVIAVIDSGCDLDHPDLRAKKWQNPGEICFDGIDNDGNGLVDDCHGWDFAADRPDVRSDSSVGHGTGAAGVLAAAPNNMIGLAGVCWGCEIMCLKFIVGNQGTVSNQVQAIDYAVKMGAWISNNSYGGYGHSELEFDAIRRAQAAGHLFIASAGNHNLNTDLQQNDHTPSSYQLSNILAVGASTYAGRKASFSNYGYKTVHLFAPGADIRTTEGASGYATVSGTSFACPHAAGAAGLIWSAFPNLTYLQVKQALIEGCQQSSSLTTLSACGGTLNVYTSLYIAAKLANALPLPGVRLRRRAHRNFIESQGDEQQAEPTSAFLAAAGAVDMETKPMGDQGMESEGISSEKDPPDSEPRPALEAVSLSSSLVPAPASGQRVGTTLGATFDDKVRKNDNAALLDQSIKAAPEHAVGESGLLGPQVITSALNTPEVDETRDESQFVPDLPRSFSLFSQNLIAEPPTEEFLKHETVRMGQSRGNPTWLKGTEDWGAPTASPTVMSVEDVDTTPIQMTTDTMHTVATENEAPGRATARQKSGLPGLLRDSLYLPFVVGKDLISLASGAALSGTGTWSVR